MRIGAREQRGLSIPGKTCPRGGADDKNTDGGLSSCRSGEIGVALQVTLSSSLEEPRRGGEDHAARARRDENRRTAQQVGGDDAENTDHHHFGTKGTRPKEPHGRLPIKMKRRHLARRPGARRPGPSLLALVSRRHRLGRLEEHAHRPALRPGQAPELQTVRVTRPPGWCHPRRRPHSGSLRHRGRRGGSSLPARSWPIARE